MRTSALVLVAAVAACKGPSGTVIFEDDFANANGGWDLVGQTIASIHDHELVLRPTGTRNGIMMMNLTFRAPASARYCTSFVLPRPAARDNAAAAGLDFWVTDYEHRTMLLVYSKATMILFDHAGGTFRQIFHEDDVAAFEAAEGATNTLCAVAKDGSLTLSLNDRVVTVVRAQIPDHPLRFGLEGGFEKAIDGAPAIRFKSFRVTTVE